MPKIKFDTRIRFLGKKFYDWRFYYHKLLSISTAQFFLLVTATFFAINIFFGFLYYVTHSITASVPLSFTDHIYFSIVTLTTLGYGDIVPVGIGRWIDVLNVFSGIIFVGVFTALLFIRLSKTPSPLIWSSPVVYFNENQKTTTVQLRITNVVGSEVINAQAYLFILRPVKTPSGQMIRKLISLPLERSHSPIATFTWILTHQADANSPLKPWIEGQADSEETLLGFVHGHDSTIGREIYSFARWQPSDLVKGEFGDVMKNLHTTTDSFSVDMDLNNIDQVVKHHSH